MNKFQRNLRLKSLMMVFSLGFLIIGFGCVSWALFNLGSPLNDSMKVTDAISVERSLNKVPTAVEPTSSKMKPEVIKPIVEQEQPQYPKFFKEGDKIGILEIPALKRKLPIIQGTSNKSLKKGAGHFTQSVLPGVADNCVISGHRDTAFRKVGALKKGDILVLKTSAGTFTYVVSGIRIVHSDDKSVIVPTDHAVLTLTTCYPFWFVGNAPDRYIISADLEKTVLSQ